MVATKRRFEPNLQRVRIDDNGTFGNGVSTGPANTLFFTAGIDDESHGLFGRLDAIQ